MFGFMEDVVDFAVDTTSNVANVGLGILTLGEYGGLNERNVKRMVRDGYEIYKISDYFNVAESVVEGMLDE